MDDILPASIVTRVESPLTGSTIASFVKQAKALGRTHFSYCDLSHMTALYKTYEMAKKADLKFIAGVTVYFRDEECEFYKQLPRKPKYFLFNLYATDQEQFLKLSHLHAKKRPVVLSYGQEMPLWNWADLKEAADLGLIGVHSNIQDIAYKYILMNKPKMAMDIVAKCQSIFRGNHYLSITGVPITHSPISVLVLETGGGRIVVPTNAVFQTNRSQRTPAEEIEINDRITHVSSYILNGIRKRINNGVIYSRKIIKGKIPTGQEDPQLMANKFAVRIGKHFNIPVLYSDEACYAEKQDKVVQMVRLAQDNRVECAERYMHSMAEFESQIVSCGGNPELIIQNQKDFCDRFNFNLSFEAKLPRFDNAIDIVKGKIKELGRLPADNHIYISRLKTELDALHKNGVIDLLPYFMPILEVKEEYTKNGVICGPARGSAGGSLLAYLIGVTDIDPIKYGLSFERFLTLDRIKAKNLPDIDFDLVSRDILTGADGRSGFLFNRWGQSVAQISTRQTLRLKSAIKDVNRALNGSVEKEIEILTKNLPSAPQGVSDSDFVLGYTDGDGNHVNGLIETDENLKKYAEQKPNEWEIVKKALGITRAYGAHAAAYVLSDNPISTQTPIFNGGLTQYDMKYVEKSGLVKYDFLVVSQLLDIQKCIELINKRNNQVNRAGFFDFNDKKVHIWDLPEDMEVFKSIWGGDTETIFQLHTSSMIPFVQKIKPKNINDISTILALVRPGPLDFIDPETGRNMAEEYIERRNGDGSKPIPEMLELLPETYGIQVYQEQTAKVAKEIGKMDPIDAENLRRAFGKKEKRVVESFKPKFLEGAIKTVGLEKAELIWAQMETSSRYSFNKSHSTGYGLISYACMFLRHHYPLEWWASIFTNASEQEISSKFYNKYQQMVVPPDVNLSTEEMVIDYDRQKIVSKLGVLRGIGESTIAKITKSRPYTDIKDFILRSEVGDSMTKKMIVAGILDSLFTGNATLEAKIVEYETQKAQIEYDQKIAQGKKPRNKPTPKIDLEYSNSSPLKIYQKRKEILPTMPIKLSEVVLKAMGDKRDLEREEILSKIAKREAKKKVDKKVAVLFNEGTPDKPIISDSRGKTFKMIPWDKVRIIESLSPERIHDLKGDTVCFCVPAYVIDIKEFTYGGGSKRAVKMNVDCDGVLTEQVLWPDYNTGILQDYPKNTKKGSIIMMFFERNIVKGRTSFLNFSLILE